MLSRSIAARGANVFGVGKAVGMSDVSSRRLKRGWVLSGRVVTDRHSVAPAYHRRQ